MYGSEKMAKTKHFQVITIVLWRFYMSLFFWKSLIVSSFNKHVRLDQS